MSNDGKPGDPPRLVVIAAPSGAGKTTLVHALVTKRPELRFSISYTTRKKRRNEAEGVDYLFVDRNGFERLRAAGEMLESAEVFDNLYGTSRRQVEQHLRAGHGVILEIDWQGARQVRAAMPDAVSVFIMPPSVAELERRLRSRGTDDEAVVARRLQDALGDMSHWAEFDHVIVNDDLETAVKALLDIIDRRGEATSTANPALRESIEALLDL